MSRITVRSLCRPLRHLRICGKIIGIDMTEGSRDRVLIADDNEANVELLEAYLADMDVEIGRGRRRAGHARQGGVVRARTSSCST